MVIDTTSVVVATGTTTRVMAFEGWTLPGVLGAGGAQALLKGSRVAPGERVVVAGTGPLLLVVADGLLRSGVDVAAVAESGHPTKYGLHPTSWSGLASRSREAAAYAGTLARHRVPYLAGWSVRAAHGTERVEGVTLTTRRGRTRAYDADALLVSHGFAPQLELLLQVGPQTRVDADGSVVVVVDDRQRTSVPGVLATGEVTGVGGAALAVLEGYLAGRALSGRDADPAVRRRIEVHRRFARTMHAVHVPRGEWARELPDAGLVCRCEEVTAGEVRDAVSGPRGRRRPRGQAPGTRVGMGCARGGCAGAVSPTWLPPRPAGCPTRPTPCAPAAGPAVPVPRSVLAREALGGDTA